jgi:hypothetical protein
MKFHGNYGADASALGRTDMFMRRRDIPMLQKIRAWNYTNKAAGFPDDGLANTPESIAWLTKEYPSDC